MHSGNGLNHRVSAVTDECRADVAQLVEHSLGKLRRFAGVSETRSGEREPAAAIPSEARELEVKEEGPM